MRSFSAPMPCQMISYGLPRTIARTRDSSLSVGHPDHVAVTHPNARALTAELIDNDVIVDFREPDVIRLGLSPLTTRCADIDAGLAMLSERLG